MFSSIRIALILVLLAGAGGGILYVKKLQSDLETARANVAKMEVAVQISEDSIKTLQNDFQKMAELNGKLQQDLQKAEAYSDELRGKLSRLDLVQDALKDPLKLQGKMNGATANLWRQFMEDTGNTDVRDLPEWLLDVDPRTREGGGDESGASADIGSSETQTSSAD